MKSVFVTCIVIAFFGAVIKMLLQTICGEKSIKALQMLIDIAILFVLVGGVMGVEMPETKIQAGDDSAILEEVEKETLREIASQAEKLLSERILTAIEEEFGITPLSCNAVIDSERLELSKLHIILDRSDIFISTYEVKSFLKENHGVNAEVVFN